MRDAAAALEAKRLAVEAEAAAAARASEAAAEEQRRSAQLKEAALTERKKVTDELHAARVEAETSRAWVRRQQEELTQRMRAATSSPRSASIGSQSWNVAGTPGSAGSVGSVDARAAAAARAAGLSGLSGLGRGVSSMLRPPGALADALSPAPRGAALIARRGEESPEAAAASAVASAVADAAARAAAQFGSPAK